MSWSAAIAWIEHLNAIQHLGYSDWDLASGISVGASQFLFERKPTTLSTSSTRSWVTRHLDLSPTTWLLTTSTMGSFVNLGTSVAAGYWVFPELIDPSCVDDGVDCFAASYRIFE